MPDTSMPGGMLFLKVKTLALTSNASHTLGWSLLTELIVVTHDQGLQPFADAIYDLEDGVLTKRAID